MRKPVLCGLDRLGAADDLLRGRRVGLMTNPTGLDSGFRSAIDILGKQYHLTALFACEHGVRGNLQAGETLSTYEDAETGVTVFSCYGETRRLTAEMLDAFDVFVFDMQDVGARFYTYLYSLSYAMEACAKADKPVVVLDRPNPVGGLLAQGTLLEERFASFVGEYAMPTRYGLTIGEYARWINDTLSLSANLTIVPMTGWKRRMRYRDTGLPWVAPSPNLPTPEAALLYTGTCPFEGTNLSEGRGTTQPFELIGAPWVDNVQLESRLNALALPGLHFRRASFTPVFSKHQGILCHGVQVHITDPETANPPAAGLHMLETLQRLHGDCFAFRARDAEGEMKIELLLGTDAFSQGPLDARALIAKSAPLVSDFQRRTEQYHLYD